MINLPYGRQTITEADIEAVVTVLRSDWLTTGPKVAEFERALAEFVGVRHAVVVNSGTAALHCAMAAIGTSPGDEVIVPSISFVATANCVVYCGGTPVFADVEADTALIDPADVERKITPRTKASWRKGKSQLATMCQFFNRFCLGEDRVKQVTRSFSIDANCKSRHVLP